MAVRKIGKSWTYDFKLEGFPRKRKAGFKSRKEAELAERKAREQVLSNTNDVLFRDVASKYIEHTPMKRTTRHHFVRIINNIINPKLGAYNIAEIKTAHLDKFLHDLSKRNQKPRTTHTQMSVVKAIIYFAWKRQFISSVPYVPMPRFQNSKPKWYTREQQMQLLEGMKQWYPQWYCFWYLTCRLGLRKGEVYAITKDSFANNVLHITHSVQHGYTELAPRKNDEAYSMMLPDDCLDVIEWHVQSGYSGQYFLFFKDDVIKKTTEGHKFALKKVQQRLHLPMYSHHVVGRHSVASNAVMEGHSLRLVQAQLGHRSQASTYQYAHLAPSASARILTSMGPLQKSSGSNEPPRAMPIHGNEKTTKRRAWNVSSRIGTHSVGRNQQETIAQRFR